MLGTVANGFGGLLRVTHGLATEGDVQRGRIDENEGDVSTLGVCATYDDSYPLSSGDGKGKGKGKE